MNPSYFFPQRSNTIFSPWTELESSCINHRLAATIFWPTARSVLSLVPVVKHSVIMIALIGFWGVQIGSAACFRDGSIDHRFKQFGIWQFESITLPVHMISSPSQARKCRELNESLPRLV